MSSPDTSFSDWRISPAQKSMITDKISKMSKKEAGLLIRIIMAIFDSRISEINKLRDEAK